MGGTLGSRGGAGCFTAEAHAHNCNTTRAQGTRGWGWVGVGGGWVGLGWGIMSTTHLNGTAVCVLSVLAAETHGSVCSKRAEHQRACAQASGPQRLGHTYIRGMKAR